MGDILVWLVTAVVGFFAGRDTAKVPLKKVPVAVAHLPGRAASHLVSQVGTTLLQLVEHIVFGVGLLAIVAALVLIAWRHRPGRARLGRTNRPGGQPVPPLVARTVEQSTRADGRRSRAATGRPEHGQAR
jgi:hypothetical protein